MPSPPADEEALHSRCREANDDKFLALLRVCEADVLVSSDDDLLVLNPWCRVPVLRPAEFLADQGAAR